MDKYLPLAYDRAATILDYYAEEESLLFVSEYVAQKERARNFSWQYQEDIKILLKKGSSAKGWIITVRNSPIFSTAVRNMTRFIWIYLPEEAAMSLIGRCFPSIPFRPRIFSGELKVLQEDIQPLLENGYCVAVLAGTGKSGTEPGERPGKNRH